MKSFQDNKGRPWVIELNVRQMKRVRDKVGIDLAATMTADAATLAKGSPLRRIETDPILFVDVLWVLCEAQAKAQGVTDEDFGSSLAGDSIAEATEAFLEEFVDFFPGARRRILRKAVELAQRQAQETEAALIAAMESPEFEERLKASLTSAGGLPASAE